MPYLKKSFARRFLQTLAFVGVFTILGKAPAQTALVYSNNFNGPVDRSYPEWTSSDIAYTNEINPPGSGILPAPIVTNTRSPNGVQTFLGEFGGPPIGKTNDPGWNQTRVNQSISLSLRKLPAHAFLKLGFDLYILKS